MAAPPSPPATMPYLMESPLEGDRLEAKTDPVAAREQLLLAGLGAGMSALDVGCGSGAVTRAMARICGPGSRVAGIDLSDQRLALARDFAQREGLEIGFLPGRAERLPVADGGFDFVWSRFLFEYLPDPDAALAEMARAARPGGTVAVADLDGQLQGFDPLEPWLAEELAVALAHLRGQGFDPDAGRKLRGRFLRAGLREVRVSVLTHQLYAGPMPEGERANWNLKLEVGCERLARLDGDAPRWRRFSAAMRELFEREDFFYHSRLVLVSGRTADCGS